MEETEFRRRYPLTRRKRHRENASQLGVVIYESRTADFQKITNPIMAKMCSFFHCAPSLSFLLWQFFFSFWRPLLSIFWQRHDIERRAGNDSRPDFCVIFVNDFIRKKSCGHLVGKRKFCYVIIWQFLSIFHNPKVQIDGTSLKFWHTNKALLKEVISLGKMHLRFEKHVFIQEPMSAGVVSGECSVKSQWNYKHIKHSW